MLEGDHEVIFSDLSWLLQVDVKVWSGEDCVVDCCHKMQYHDKSMQQASLFGSGMFPESILESD